MVTSHLLTIAQSGTLFEPQSFLRTLDQTKVVDRAADGVMWAVVDFLGSEARISLPPGNVTDHGAAVRPPEGLRVVTCLSRHDARVLRSRLRKRQLHQSGAELVCESFCLHDESSRDAVRQCLHLLDRQTDHFTSDDERIIIVVGPDAVEEHGQASGG